MSNFYSLVTSATADENKALFILPDGRSTSYGDTFELARRFANVLVEKGLRPGDRVAVQAPKSWQNVALYLGVLNCGGVYLPLNEQYTNAELAYFLSDAEAHTFVCAPERLTEVSKVADKASVRFLTSLGRDGEGELDQRAREAKSGFKTVARHAEDLAAILYTSGTTGRSKGAMLTHENLASNAEMLVDAWAFTSEDVLLHALPIFHTHGLFVAINTIMMAGGNMIFLPKFDADVVLDKIAGATAIMGVPTIYTRLLAHEDLARTELSHMRLFTCGSAPLLAETLTEFEYRTGHRILERYGMTETNMTISNPYRGERRAGTVGHPLPGCEVRIMDEQTGKTVGTEEIGMIEVRGPGVFKGYWRQPEKTKAEIREDGFFITGDLGKRDADGYIQIVDRAKDLIITGGYNVYPKEVEAEVDQLDGVVESAVIGVPDPDFGETVVAVVVLEPGASLTLEDAKVALADRLSKFKQPTQIHTVDSLPRNIMGKIQKAALRAQCS